MKNLQEKWWIDLKHKEFIYDKDAAEIDEIAVSSRNACLKLRSKHITVSNQKDLELVLNAVFGSNDNIEEMINF